MGWIGSVIYLVAPKQPQDFDFFNGHGPRVLIIDLSLFNIETYAPQFIGHNKFFLDSVFSVWPKPGFGIGDRNQVPISVSVSEPKLFFAETDFFSILLIVPNFLVKWNFWKACNWTHIYKNNLKGLQCFLLISFKK